MISTLKGRVQHKGKDGAVIETAGVGYQVLMPTGALAQLPEAGGEVFVHTYLHVRADIMQLYGFRSRPEKELFIKLISISNIGPKAALALLSSFSVADFTKAAAAGDVELITTVPGIGRKTAQRIILELREKLDGLITAAVGESTGPVVMEARQALMGLGYTLSEANQALRDCGDDMKLDECLKQALRKLGGG